MKKIIALLKDKPRLWHIIFESNDRSSRAFDVVVMSAIVISIVCALLESSLRVEDFSMEALLNQQMTTLGIIKMIIIVMEYVLSLLFTVEYVLRVYCSPVKKDYVLSFFGIIDLLATVPQLLSIFFPPLRYLSLMRAFRLIRIFRVLKLFSFINEGYLLLQSIRMSMNKICVYFLFVLSLVTVIGTLMYMVECDAPGSNFKDIPNSIYWAIVTLTTVGYGDITPVTGVGKFLSSLVMILGYTIIAVPTGIVSATMIDETKRRGTNGRCPRCNQKTDLRANYCKHCGEKLK